MIDKCSVWLPNSEYSEFPVACQMCDGVLVFSELLPAVSTRNNYELACLLLTFQVGKITTDSTFFSENFEVRIYFSALNG